MAHARQYLTVTAVLHVQRAQDRAHPLNLQGCAIKAQLPDHALRLLVLSTPYASALNPPTMRHPQLSILGVLLSAPLHNIAKPLAQNWDHIRVKHTWNNVPPNWESLGLPPAGTTIDLNIVLKSQNENALIDALYDVSNPGSSRHVIFETLPVTMYSPVPRSVTDMVNTCQGRGSLNSSARTKTRWSSYTPGLETITYRLLPSQRLVGAAC